MAKELPDRDNSDSMTLGHLDQIEVAFEIVIPGDEVS
jgi:hypothetical protein